MTDGSQKFLPRRHRLRSQSPTILLGIPSWWILLLVGSICSGCGEPTILVEEAPPGIQPISVDEDAWESDGTKPITSEEEKGESNPLEKQRSLVRDKINPIEDATEAFVHSINDMSDFLRLGDMDSFSDYFPAGFVGTPFPQELPPRKPELRWIDSRHWPVQPTMKPLTKAEVKHSTRQFLDRIPQLESVRFKVPESTWENERLSGKLLFQISGRNEEGLKEWIKGEGRFAAHPVNTDLQRWEIDSLQWTEIRSLVARRDLFEEVTEAAGLQTPPPDSPGGGLMAEMEAMSQAFNGAAVTDLNNDGFLDLIVCGKEGNRLYMNQGNGTFSDRANEMGLTVPMRTQVAAAPLFIDIDNDGDQDLFISGTSASRLYENRHIPDGKIQFVDISTRAGIGHKLFSYMSVAGDVNGDGFVDIYVTSYNNFPWVLPDNWARATNGIDNLLYLNQTDGTFKEVGKEWGVAGGRWTFAAQMGDMDEDGDLDIYVANDYGSGSTLYRNEGDHFVDAGEETGLFDFGAGMGVSMGDYNNDGKLDLHLTNMSSMAGSRIFHRFEGKDLPDLPHFEKLVAGNMLFKNKGDGTFEEVSKEAGPINGGWAWGGGFVDLDNDGWEDLHSPNGFMSGKSINDT